MSFNTFKLIHTELHPEIIKLQMDITTDIKVKGKMISLIEYSKYEYFGANGQEIKYEAKVTWEQGFNEEDKKKVSTDSLSYVYYVLYTLRGLIDTIRNKTKVADKAENHQLLLKVSRFVRRVYKMCEELDLEVLYNSEYNFGDVKFDNELTDAEKEFLDKYSTETVNNAIRCFRGIYLDMYRLSLTEKMFCEFVSDLDQKTVDDCNDTYEAIKEFLGDCKTATFREGTEGVDYWHNPKTLI